MPSHLEQSVARFRAALFQQESDARRAMRQSYETALSALQLELAATLVWIDELRAETGTVPTWRLLKEQRLRQLIARSEIEFGQFGDMVGTEMIQAQLQAIAEAQAAARALIAAAFGPAPAGATLPVHTLPAGAIEQLTAVLQPDAPVRALLQEFAGSAADAVQAEIIGGVARGESAAMITRAIVAHLDASHRARAERIVRTEMMRAFRESMRETYVANRHLMRGWIWYAALDKRCCPVCIAMHGKLFDVETKMATHPNCRCVLLPRTKSWRDLGYDVPDHQLVITPGPDLFRTWSDDRQVAVLGPAAHAAFEAGDLELSDLVAITRSIVWGTGRRRVSLQRALQKGQRAA